MSLLKISFAACLCLTLTAAFSNRAEAAHAYPEDDQALYSAVFAPISGQIDTLLKKIDSKEALSKNDLDQAQLLPEQVDNATYFTQAVPTELAEKGKDLRQAIKLVLAPRKRMKPSALTGGAQKQLDQLVFNAATFALDAAQQAFRKDPNPAAARNSLNIWGYILNCYSTEQPGSDENLALQSLKNLRTALASAHRR